MGMDTVEFIYLVCFFLGLGFAIISGLLSGVFSGADGGVDGGGDVDAGGADGADGGDGGVHFSPFSPVVLAMFIASFGGAGIIFKKVLEWPLIAHVPAAGACGVGIATLVFLFFWKLFKMAQGTSQVRASEAIGIQAEITVDIPNDGLGQIGYTLGGMRHTNPAKSVGGKELPAGLVVKIVDRVGNTYLVEKTN